MPDNIMTMEAPVFRNRSTEIDKLAAALVQAQAAMTGASKDATNPHFKNKYADLSSVWDAVRKPLTDNGLAVLQFPRTVEGGVEIETTLLHATGQYLKDVLWVPASKQDAQGIGSAITYGRRYALMSVTGIAPVDDDGNDAVASYKAASGTAGAGTQFRPERRQQSSWGEGGKQAAIDEAQRDGLTANAKPKPLPGAAAGRTGAPIKTATEAGNAIKRIEWVKASAAYLADKDEHVARDWWIENKARIDVIETALPTEYERLLDAYNEALERKVPA